MTITQLKYCIAVAEYKNFTLAAEKIFVTQPTLSMQVHKLEEELGTKIFDRSKKPIQITEVGEKIIEQAKNIVAESTRMSDVVAQEKGMVSGIIKIGIIPTVMPTLLPMFLTNLIRKYPKLFLEIEELSTQRIIEKLENGQLDMAIAATPLSHKTIKEKPLYYEPFMAYVPGNTQLQNKEKVSVTDLINQKLLLLQDGHCFRDSVLNICKRNDQHSDANFNIHSGSFETLIQLANEGMGITLLPYLNTLNMRRENQKHLRNFISPSPAREVSLIYNRKELKLHIIEAIHHLISSIVRGAIVFQEVDIISPKRVFQ